MKVHDYHLRGYQVEQFGSMLTLDLVYDYAGQSKCETQVRFSGVQLYHLTHTAGTILYGIERVVLDALLEERTDFIESAAQMYGVKGWRDGMSTYRAYLFEQGVSAWEITSSIGFDGFVIGRAVDEV